MALPATTLALTLFGEYTLVVRSSMLETLGEDYVLTARAKGLPQRRIVVAPRAAQRDAADRHARRAVAGVHRGRRDLGGDRLLVAGDRPARVFGGLQPRLPDAAGRVPDPHACRWCSSTSSPTSSTSSWTRGSRNEDRRARPRRRHRARGTAVERRQPGGPGPQGTALGARRPAHRAALRRLGGVRLRPSPRTRWTQQSGPVYAPPSIAALARARTTAASTC